jgi:hypothetical protein
MPRASGVGVGAGGDVLEAAASKMASARTVAASCRRRRTSLRLAGGFLHELGAPMYSYLAAELDLLGHGARRPW